MQTESNCFLIHYSNKKCLLWNTEDIRCLRNKYRIVGSLVGCLPVHSYQNSQLGLPLQLMREEVGILLENKACKLVSFSEKRYYIEDEDVCLQFKDTFNKSFEEYKSLLRNERIKQLKRKCEEISSGKRKRLKESNDEPQSHERCIGEEIKRLPEVSIDLFPIQLFTRCPLYSKSSDELSEYFKDITSQFNYPETDEEILKYSVFKDFWKKGYFLTNGFKFGCDYLVYEGDPLICHAKYMIICVSVKKLSILNLHILGRLSVQVNKQVLIASIDAEDNVIYKSLNCDILRNPFK